MTDGGSIFTLTYFGGDKVVPNYGIMGPAKSCLEGLVRYLAAELGPKNISVNAISPAFKAALMSGTVLSPLSG